MQFNILPHFHLEHEPFWNCWSHKAESKLCSLHGFGNCDASDIRQYFPFFPSLSLLGHHCKQNNLFPEVILCILRALHDLCEACDGH